MAALLTGLVLAGSAAAQSSQGAAAGETVAREGGAVHVVEPGDTLWVIARGIVGPEGDPRPMVDRIRETNDLDGPLLAGTRLVLPRA